IKIFCETAIGKINDGIKSKKEGPDVKIGFNNKYMLEALKNTECEKIKLEINGPISPIKIVPIDDDSFLFLVLPVRLK
ncbi:MAG: DNA polymerase III subunit beta, partial [Oscillospiraceae bacterium]